MNKKVVRLTESDLHRIVENSVHSILSENEENEWGNIFTKDGRQEWLNLGKSLTQGAKAGVAAARGHYQGSRNQNDLYGAYSNVNAQQRLQDIDNACRELRTQYNNLLAQRKEFEAYCEKRGLAKLNRKPFQRNKIDAMPTSVRGGKIGTNYTPEDGGIRGAV